MWDWLNQSNLAGYMIATVTALVVVAVNDHFKLRQLRTQVVRIEETVDKIERYLWRQMKNGL